MSLTIAASAIAEAGYRGIEIYADYPHLYPLETTVETQLEAARTLDELGLLAANVNAFTMFRVMDTWRPSYLEIDEEFRAKRLDHTVAALEMAHRIDCPTVSTEPGGQLSSSMTREQGMKMFVNGVKEVLERTADLDVALLFEPEPGLLVENSEHAEVFKLVDDPRFAMNFDAGHFFCVGEDPAKVARDFAGRFDHVHIEDIAADRKHFHLIPGDGAIDFRALFEALEDIGYDAFVTVELYPHQDDPTSVARNAMEYLAPIWKETFGEGRRE
ncbi:MAG: sugar phosphate isomerase/epimerase family protein [Planctomycetota bacterium]|nr:sugar phosphate isomerase/epimerase family protein [Planctomycetota bacterium]